MIIDKIGDILHTEADVICHQVNCKSFKLFVELLEDDTSYDNIILGAVNHDDTLEQLKGTGLKIVNL